MRNYKKDFPIFKKNPKLVYLDSAATSQKPQAVIDSIKEYYETYNANVRRGLYPLSEKATAKVEEVRAKVAKFINAKSSDEIIFVRNATEAVNLVCSSWGGENVKKGDSVWTTVMEHHSNFVPWQQLAKQKKAHFEVFDIDNEYKLITNKKSMQNVKLISLTHLSNVLGTVNPIKKMIHDFRLKNKEVKILIDAAQSVPHMKVDVQDFDCDFLVFSGHKMLAGTGIGILYGKKALLERMQPFLFGGEMIREVSIAKTTFADVPNKFEAGTPDIGGIVSLGAAIDYLELVGMERIENHESRIMKYAMKKLTEIEGLKIYGPIIGENRASVISFNLDSIHAHDAAQILGDMGICIRSGHHCAMPLHERLGIQASARVSFYLYNDEEDIDRLIIGIKKVKKIFAIL